MLEHFLLLLFLLFIIFIFMHVEGAGRAEAKFLVPDCGQAGRVRQPYAIVDYIPLSQGTKNLVTASEESEVLKIFHKKSRNLFRTWDDRGD